MTVAVTSQRDCQALPMSLTPELCGFHGAYAEETLLRKKTSEEKHYPPLCKVHGNKPTIIASHSWRY